LLTPKGTTRLVTEEVAEHPNSLVKGQHSDDNKRLIKSGKGIKTLCTKKNLNASKKKHWGESLKKKRKMRKRSSYKRGKAVGREGIKDVAKKEKMKQEKLLGLEKSIRDRRFLGAARKRRGPRF